MRGGKVPIRIALAGAKQAAVTHIDGDQQTLTGLCRHRTLTQNHVLHINIVVNRCKLFSHMESHPFDNGIHYRLPVQLGKTLCNFMS